MLSSSMTAFAADAVKPSDIETLTGTAGNTEVSLTWSAATDDTGVDGYQVHYGLNPVDAAGETYDFVDDVGNVTQYTLTGLENDTTYYFSIIAYDAAGNESLAWAPELELTPSATPGSADTEAPKVMEATALNSEEVKVVFSEGVILPETDANLEFDLENQDNFELLGVLEAKLDEEDLTGTSVILLTEKQTAGTEYKITVNLGVTDMAGNNIISGTSDTALFTGSDALKPSDDSTAPQLLSLEALDSENLFLQFDEAIVLGIDPTENFTIVAENDATDELTILGVTLGDNDAGVANASVLITTSLQSDASYLLRVVGVKDMSGNEVSSTEASDTFMGMGEAKVDGEDPVVVPPVENPEATKYVANFLANKMFKDDSFFVTLNWTLISDVQSMISEQKIYMSKDKGSNYDLEAVLAADTEKYEVGALAAGEYWFKLTQLDAEGVENEGTTTKIILAETGPEVFGFVLVSLGLGTLFRKKEKI